MQDLPVAKIASALCPRGYWSELFPGLLQFGLGLVSATVVWSIVAMSDVPERSSGIASGINPAAFHLGGAFGSAFVTTVVVSSRSHAPLTTALSRGVIAGTVFAGFVVVAIAQPRSATEPTQVGAS